MLRDSMHEALRASCFQGPPDHGAQHRNRSCPTVLTALHTFHQKWHTADPSGGPTKSFFALKKDEGSHLVIMNCNELVRFKVAHDRTGENLPMFKRPTAQGLLIRNLQSQNKNTAIKM